MPLGHAGPPDPWAGLLPQWAAWRHAATQNETAALERFRAARTPANIAGGTLAASEAEEPLESVLEALAGIAADDPEGRYIATLDGWRMSGAAWQLMIGLPAETLRAEAYTLGDAIYLMRDVAHGRHSPVPIIAREEPRHY